MKSNSCSVVGLKRAKVQFPETFKFGTVVCLFVWLVGLFRDLERHKALYTTS